MFLAKRFLNSPAKWATDLVKRRIPDTVEVSGIVLPVEFTEQVKRQCEDVDASNYDCEKQKFPRLTCFAELYWILHSS